MFSSSRGYRCVILNEYITHTYDGEVNREKKMEPGKTMRRVGERFVLGWGTSTCRVLLMGNLSPYHSFLATPEPLEGGHQVWEPTNNILLL